MRPDQYPRFAEFNQVDPITKQNNVVEPTDAKKNYGWGYRDKGARQYFNYLHRLTYQWIVYLDSTVAGYNTTIENLNTTFNTFSTNLQDFTDRLEAAEDSILTNATNITDLTGRVGTAETDITNVTGRVGTAETNILTNSTKINSFFRTATAGKNIISSTVDANNTAYTRATMPTAVQAGAGAIIYITDANGGGANNGPMLIFSNGTNWYRVTDKGVQA